MQDEILYIPYKDTKIPCVIKRSKRRRSVSISVKPDTTVIIHAPMRESIRSLQTVLDTNQVWVLNTYENARTIYSKYQSSYQSGDTVLYMGKLYTICYDVHMQQDVRIDQNTIYVHAVDNISCRLAILAFYRKQAKTIFTDRVSYWVPYVDGAKALRKTTIKHTTSRWGSMSSKGDMHLNTALIRTPLDCIDYVIVHELCHIHHPHHQKAFWDAVEKVMPEYKKYKTMLKSYPTEY